MNLQKLLPVYQVETLDDINYVDICNEIPVGGKFIVAYPENFTEYCERVEVDLIKVVGQQEGNPEAWVTLDKNFKVFVITS